ncbi:hypothetical protein U5A82_06215 [Sphingobium sp. CR2-8]|uniref:hypothetical protein n=1 Tax=Sphingobium sp. CR2-8 TaxID=1306534 RepID=UPI002DB8A898|nr:hypothetical protein [Sphingobium sp. CR2-8]MEC3910083.1 hypothetical protein [Sphingobium sp. CR2-8]
MTRDEARKARDLLRVELNAVRKRDEAITHILYSNGNYRTSVTIEEREALLAEHSIVWRERSRLARFDRAYNDIIAYRPDAKLDPADRDHETRWEAWDGQDWKQEKAEAAQAWLAEVAA